LHSFCQTSFRLESNCFERRAKIAFIGSLYRQYSPPRVNRSSDILDRYASLADRENPDRIARAMSSRARSAFASDIGAVA
jgi:hypothetical protein